MKKRKPFLTGEEFLLFRRILRIMKLTTFLVLLTTLMVSASVYSQSTRLTLQFSEISYEQLFREIEKQTEFRFAFSNSKLDSDQKIKLDVTDETLEKILDKALPEGIAYEIVDRYVVILNAFDKVSIAEIKQQQPAVSGTVTDESGQPLPGVTVVVKGTTRGTVTNTDGEYSLANIPENATLVFSFVGMRTQEVVIEDKAIINIEMAVDAVGLEEVVAVGYGIQKKASLTGSISTVKGDNLSKSTSINFSNTLAGQLPGLVVMTPKGEPGNDASVLRIRGANTLGNNNPLVVVDGVSNRTLDRLDPASIESVTVLKDASAAIYGAQAANGVILVTTKRGQMGKPQIQLSLNQGWNTPTVLPQMADSYTYGLILNEIKSYAGQVPKYTTEELQKFKDGSDPLRYPNTDWFKETLRKWTPQRYGNMSLAGGAEKIKYFVSVGSNFHDGIYKNNAVNYSQLDFRSNLDAEITNNIQLSFDIAGRQEKRNYPGISNSDAWDGLARLQRAYPYLRATWPNGLPTPGADNDNALVIFGHDSGYDRTKTYVMQSNTKLIINIPWIKGLSLTTNASIDKTFINRKKWKIPFYLYNWDGNTLDSNNEPVLSLVTVGTDPSLQQWMYDNGDTFFNGLINYEKTIAKIHNIKGLLGIERYKGESMNFNAFRRYFPTTALDEMFAGGDLLKNNSGSSSDYVRLNYFGRINYDLNSKYLAELVWRYDGSYIFPESSRFGFFPGMSLGWRISDESFWKEKLSFINEMKIRGSWGLTGNDRIDPYQYLSSFRYSGTYILNQSIAEKTISALRIPNPDITWEIANQTNVGFDAQLFNGNIFITGDYFYNLRNNILWWRNASVPASAGISLPRENIGEVVNKGFEVQLGKRNNAGDFKYEISANIAYAKNQIKFWDETPGVPEYQRSTGKPMGAGLYYQAIGIFKDQAAVDAYPHWKGARPGDIIFEDVNKDGVIDGLDRVRSNKTSLPKLTGGLTANLQYKNIYINILFQGATGAQRQSNFFSGEAGNFVLSEIEDRWTADNTNGTQPRAWNRAREYWAEDGLPNNTYWLRNNDYLRLKNIELGFDVPSNFLMKTDIEALNFYISGQNIFTITPLKDYDPESPDTGAIWVNNLVYPTNLTVSCGLRLTF
jgi:TonB-dependent starch-binding outer membrane protein SusC